MKTKKHSIKRVIICSAIFCTLFFSFSTTSSGLGSKHHMDTACIAETIYREARGEPFKGQLAVGQVVLNRVKHSKYPDSVCAVVFQKHQFEWTRKFRKFKAPAQYYQLAERIRRGEHEFKHFKATHFHAHYVRPKWRKNLKHVATIGNHIFYTL